MTHPELHQRIHDSFVRQGLMQHLGARLISVVPGEVELALPYSERVTQQQGGYHGGAMGALADIAAGYAGLTRAPEDMEVTTVEYKINFLAAFSGGELRARGHVVRAGRRRVALRSDAADAGRRPQELLTPFPHLGASHAQPARPELPTRRRHRRLA